LAGSSTPTIETSSGKMVVSSKGLLQTLDFFHTVFADGLGAPTSQLFSPNNAPNIPSTDFFKGTLGIAVGANFLGGNWTKQVSFPYWAKASTAMGVAGTSQDQRWWLRLHVEWLGLRHVLDRVTGATDGGR
jgi:hypothetical protein